MKKKLQLFKYRCGACGSEYKAPAYPSAAYGEFILRSENGVSLAYLNALNDPVFEETETIVKSFSGISSKEGVASTLKSVFGVTCDPDADGNSFAIGLAPRCPQCGSIRPSYWEATEPPEFVEKPVPDVTHEKWSNLSEDEKHNLIKVKLRELGVVS